MVNGTFWEPSRSLLGTFLCRWLALEAMPLGDATTVVYIAPVFTALFARLFLAERTGA